ncbi:MAG TPA: acyl-CoA synthetase [Acidimicrobiales bacterium]
MTDWNFADVYEAVATKLPEAPSQIQGQRTLSWADVDRRANGLAHDLLDAGLGHQAKVAAYLYNGPEYLESYLAAFKAGLVPVNTNYRYGPEEIAYLFDNSDTEAVVFHTSFTELLDKVRSRLPGVRRWYAVDDGGTVPEWSTPYEEVVRAGRSDPVRGPWGRSGDDLLLLYTGGTTGLPKGVMWRQDDLFRVLGGGGNPVLGEPPAADLDDFSSRITRPGFVTMPACPLMHGTGQFIAFVTLNGGGCIVTLEGRSFDAAELWRAVERQRVNGIAIVGDAFARPMLAELEAQPGRYDTSSLLLLSSSGVMWSQETKTALLELMPQVILFDSLGSSEAVGLAASISAGGNATDTAQFQLGERVRVFTDDGREVAPGSDDVGMVAISGFIPLGYYKDEAKTARTFRTFDGVRYSIPGDYAQVNPDRSLHLLGRGSVCINTGGEKVYPEEVEEVLKEDPAVADAACVGVPDERFGESICALIQPVVGTPVDEEQLTQHVRGRLAGFKVPRSYITVQSLGRSPAGKLDYPGLSKLARASVSSSGEPAG